MLLADLESIVPPWMVRAPRQQWSRLMAGIAGVFDAMAEGVQEARYAAMPGQIDVPGGNGFDDATALPHTGRDRSIRQGLKESIFSWAAAQRNYQNAWAIAATPYGLLLQLQRILSPNPPTVSIVDTHGQWFRLFADGKFLCFRQSSGGFDYHPDGFLSSGAVVPDDWDWDSLADPPPFGFGDASRFWVIIEAPSNLPYLAGISGHIGDGRRIGAGLNTPDAATIGTTAPIKQADLVRTLILEWRSAGLRCSHVIIAFDIAQFGSPTGSAHYPQGDYGWPCHVVGGVMVPARDSSARYWRAEPGGYAGS